METRLKDVYAKIAADYVVYHSEMPQAVELCARLLLSRLGNSPTVLDVGCGPGRDMAWFEAQGALVTGVDASSTMLDHARERVKGDLIETDMRNLGFPSNSFDAVWCAASLLHLPKLDAPRVLTDFGRILVPGGHLYLSLKPGQGENWEVCDWGPPVKRFFARYSLTEVEAMLSAAGFQVWHHKETENWLEFLAEQL